MLSPEDSSQFHRDVKRAQKRGKNMAKLKNLLSLLIAEEPLPPRHRDHVLKNNWSEYRDAHIEPDWLLIYCIQNNVVASSAPGPVRIYSNEVSP
jgi:mRNA interferase YafQ